MSNGIILSCFDHQFLSTHSRLLILCRQSGTMVGYLMIIDLYGHIPLSVCLCLIGGVLKRVEHKPVKMMFSNS